MNELRIKNNKQNRQKQMRKSIIYALGTIFLVFSLAFTINGFFSNAKSNKDTNQTKYYTSIIVEAGDTLWSIASKKQSEHYNSIDQYVKEVMHMNSLMNEKITVGQYLVIPYYAECKSSRRVHDAALKTHL